MSRTIWDFIRGGQKTKSTIQFLSLNLSITSLVIPDHRTPAPSANPMFLSDESSEHVGRSKQPQSLVTACDVMWCRLLSGGSLFSCCLSYAKEQKGFSCIKVLGESSSSPHWFPFPSQSRFKTVWTPLILIAWRTSGRLREEVVDGVDDRKL